MKTRTIHELLKICLDNFDKHFDDGLCNFFIELRFKNVITIEEEEKILKYLFLNRPDNKRTRRKYIYFWKQFERKCRINWLKKHYKLTETI